MTIKSGNLSKFCYCGISQGFKYDRVLYESLVEDVLYNNFPKFFERGILSFIEHLSLFRTLLEHPKVYSYGPHCEKYWYAYQELVIKLKKKLM